MTDPEQRKAFVAELHRLKTDIFMRMVESGAMPLRPGVRRLVGTCPSVTAVPTFERRGCLSGVQQVVVGALRMHCQGQERHGPFSAATALSRIGLRNRPIPTCHSSTGAHGHDCSSLTFCRLHEGKLSEVSCVACAARLRLMVAATQASAA